MSFEKDSEGNWTAYKGEAILTVYLDEGGCWRVCVARRKWSAEKFTDQVSAQQAAIFMADNMMANDGPVPHN